MAVTATSGSVTIENLQIAGPGSAAGILLGTAGSAVTVSQNTITGNGTGIWVDGGDLAFGHSELHHRQWRRNPNR